MHQVCLGRDALEVEDGVNVCACAHTVAVDAEYLGICRSGVMYIVL